MFSIVEMLLEVIYTYQSTIKIDLESMLIVLCVNDATMRPFMTDPNTPESVLRMERPPESVRGSISRRMIADKTGLSRETVRRRTIELAEMGLIVIDPSDGVRASQQLDNRIFQHMLEAGHEAVLNYTARLRSLGIDPAKSYKKPG